MPPDRALGGNSVLQDARLLSTLLASSSKPTDWPKVIAKYEKEMFARVRIAVPEKENVEPTNNAAEISLRFGVIWGKLYHQSQSEKEHFVERVMTVAMTLRLRVKNTFQYFTECFRAFIRGGRSPPVFGS